MKIDSRPAGDVVVLDLAGALAGRSAADAVGQTVCRLARQGARTIVVNLARVRAVDLSGLNALVESGRELRSAGVEIRLAALTRRLHDPVVLTRLLTTFATFETVEQAIGGPIGTAEAPVGIPPSPLALAMLQRFHPRA